MRKAKKIPLVKDKHELGDILFEANKLIERQIITIRRDLDSFTDFIADLKKDSSGFSEDHKNRNSKK
jgi:hypothetical protein